MTNKETLSVDNLYLVFNRKEWEVYGWFSAEELDQTPPNGFIGQKNGVDCYMSSFIPSNPIVHE